MKLKDNISKVSSTFTRKYSTTVKKEVKVVVTSLGGVQFFVTPWFFYPWNYPGKNTGVGSHFFL